MQSIPSLAQSHLGTPVPVGHASRRHFQTLRRCLGLGAVCGLLACQAQPSPVAGPSASSPVVREFAGKGIIQQLEPENGKVLIQHEAIPDFMAAMTMPFRVKTAEALAGIKAGDQVAFKLFVTGEESWIEQVVKIKTAAPEGIAARPAPAPAPPPMATVSPKRHPLLDYAFTNELGQPVRLGDFRGQVLALNFIFTRCPIPDYCPRLSRNFEEAARKLREMPGGPTNYHFLSVSFDTEFDTPEVLKAYGQRYGYDPAHWSFLTGPADKIAELARLSDMKYEGSGGVFSHNLRTLIIDPNGRLRMSFPIGGNLADAIVSEILKATATNTPPGQPGAVAVH